MKLPATIAIHGVGSHRPGEIDASVSRAFTRAAMTSDVSEFNWDAFIEQSVQRMGDGVALLNQTAESIARTAALRLPASASKTDRRLQQLGDALYHCVFRLLVAAILTILTIGPVIHLLALLPSLAFTSSWPDFSWIATAARAGIVAAAVVFACMLGLDGLRSVAIRSTAPLRVTIRRAGLLVLQPLILLLTIPMAARVGNGLVTFVAGVIPMMVVSGVLNLLVSPLSGKFNFMAVSIAGTAAFLAAVAIFGLVHIVARQMWIGGPLKVVLDIVRYMGSPNYRTTLQLAFDERIHALEAEDSGARSVMLLAHSLGSVIALDSLINSTAWKTTDTVYLVTLGSPIRRSFIRFFPGYLFPPSVEGAARAAAARVNHLSWINVHRRWDYVGTGLGLNRDGLGQDLCTGQLTRVMRSHSDYWSDDIVASTVKDGLERAKPVISEARTATAAATHADPDIEESEYLFTVARLVRALAIVMMVGVVGTTAVSFTRAWSTWVNDIKSGVAEVARTGTRALADVTYHRTLEASGEDAYYLHHFVFNVPGLQKPLGPIEIQDRAIDYRFDYKGLAAFVLEKCERAEQKRWWQIFKSVQEIPCTRTAVPLLYDAARSDSIWLPQFPPRSGKWDHVWDAVGLILVGSFFAIGCWFVIVVEGLRLFKLFLGLGLTEDRARGGG
jgi:hypothetical protein